MSCIVCWEQIFANPGAAWNLAKISKYWAWNCIFSPSENRSGVSGVGKALEMMRLRSRKKKNDLRKGVLGATYTTFQCECPHASHCHIICNNMNVCSKPYMVAEAKAYWRNLPDFCFFFFSQFLHPALAMEAYQSNLVCIHAVVLSSTNSFQC